MSERLYYLTYFTSLKIHQLCVHFKLIGCEFWVKVNRWGDNWTDHRKSDDTIYGRSRQSAPSVFNLQLLTENDRKQQRTSSDIIGHGLNKQKRLWNFKLFALVRCILRWLDVIVMVCKVYESTLRQRFTTQCFPKQNLTNLLHAVLNNQASHICL